MQTLAARESAPIAASRWKLRGLGWPLFVVATITAAAFALRFSQLHQSIYGDEVWTYQDVIGRSLSGVLTHVHDGVEDNPPLFFLLAWVSAKVGDPTVWIRLPSLILGAATIWLTYLLGRLTVGRVAGVIGAAVIAFSPFSTYYGVEARAYATLAFFVALSTTCLLLAVGSGRRRWWALYVLAATAAAYTHYTAIFVLAAQGAWSLWACRDRLEQPLLANAMVAVLYVPWLTQMHGLRINLFAGLEPLTAANVLRDLPRPLVGYPYASLSAIPTSAGLIAIGLCALAGAAAMLHQVRVMRWRLTLSRATGLLLIVAAATPLGLLLYSLFGSDIWAPRNLEASAPAAALALGALLVALPRMLRLVAVGVVLAALITGSIRATEPSYVRPPFRSAAELIDKTSAPRDPVVLYPSFLNLTNAIPLQLHRPHPILHGVPARWPRALPGEMLYVVVDDAVARQARLPAPHPPGFTPALRRHYTGLYSFTVIAFRADS